jgi:hypothetical protein
MISRRCRPLTGLEFLGEWNFYIDIAPMALGFTSKRIRLENPIWGGISLMVPAGGY